jgi:hypothetical protein
MKEDGLPEPTTAEILGGFAVDVETFFAVLDDDANLDADTKAALTRHFEAIAETVEEARKLIKESSEIE